MIADHRFIEVALGRNTATAMIPASVPPKSPISPKKILGRTLFFRAAPSNDDEHRPIGEQHQPAKQTKCGAFKLVSICVQSVAEECLPFPAGAKLLVRGFTESFGAFVDLPQDLINWFARRTASDGD